MWLYHRSCLPNGERDLGWKSALGVAGLPDMFPLE